MQPKRLINIAGVISGFGFQRETTKMCEAARNAALK